MLTIFVDMLCVQHMPNDGDRAKTTRGCSKDGRKQMNRDRHNMLDGTMAVEYQLAASTTMTDE